ncbi:hypothetical protein TanjilG_30217 [Lupinus angustifolius]|uniref:Interactor of constitutive active ROPs 3 n=1 Tax=Lupinus angustifolius TaxID=3871 RepID=A0A4P1R6X5_LUPAN|nr:PREDICTED: interactor of constitutive active ROPs 3-like [Lupinus angustifolius]OIW03941.1 hypothetical protein TanjilG_30217 [Lupinus angustifolius]
MQNPKARTGSLEIPKKFLRTAAFGTAPVTPLNQANKTSKDRTPKITECRSYRSQVPERKRPSRISELESQISQLKVDLKNLRDQLCLSESCKKQHQQDAEDYKEQLLALSVKLEDSQHQLLKLTVTEEACVTETKKIAEENDGSWQWQTVNSAINEIQQLKVHLEFVANFEKAQAQLAESLDLELLELRQNLSEHLSLLENMKNQLMDSSESSQSNNSVNDTLKQLEASKRTLEILRDDAAKSVHGYNSTALKLDQSRARVNSLEAMVRKLFASITSNKCRHCANLAADDFNFEKECERMEKGEDPNEIEAEIHSLKSAIEVAKTKHQEQQILSTVNISNAYEFIDLIKSESSQRDSELEDNLKSKKGDIEELKANLMDKETELQHIMEENKKLNLKLEKNMLLSSQREYELRMELKRLYECVAELKGDLMDKEKTLQNISEDNEMLKLEINNKLREEVAAENEARIKLGIMVEEANRNNQKAMMGIEKLEVAEAAKSELEAELRRVKIQCDQWRKAAEAAAAIVSDGNNGKITERSLSLDNNYNLPLIDKYSTYNEEVEDDIQRRKNGNMLKKFAVLWKKPQK